MKNSANEAVSFRLAELVAEGKEIGVQVCAYQSGHLVIDAWAGFADPVTRRPVDGDTLFNVFSVTKAVAATALHIQAERGLLNYTDTVAKHWPEFAAAGKQAVSIRDVLTHRSGVPQMPEGVTPELMCNWRWMTDAIAAQAPMFRPHIDSAYQSMTFGWIVGEIVQRVDPAGRDIGRFVREEIAGPLGITDLWIGLPASEEPRMAMMDGSAVYDFPDGTPYRAACPRQVDLMPEPFGRSRVRRAIIPAVGGIFNARSGARFFAMLANGGELDGVRLLSEQSVAALSEPRERASQPDPVFFGMVIPMGSGGFWLGSDSPPTAAPRNPKAICHPGMGGAIGWADPDRALAVMYCRNRLYNPTGPEDDNATMIADVIRELVNAS